MKYKKLDIKGLIVAAFSPFHVDGSINSEPIPELVDQLIAKGINGFYLLGSTGEGLSLTVKQRMDVTESYIRAIDGRAPVIVNVSHTSYEVSSELTTHAVETGANAVSATLPTYYKISGLDFKIHSFLEMIGDTIPHLQGIKYTSPAIDDFMICMQRQGNTLGCVGQCYIGLVSDHVHQNKLFDVFLLWTCLLLCFRLFVEP